MKKILRSIFNKCGYDLIKTNIYNGKPNLKIGEFAYENILPTANYAPWLTDEAFKTVYAEVSANTLVDVYRCYEIWQLIEKIHQLDSTVNYIEIGVWRGGTAGIAGKKLALLKANCNFYLADTFTGVPKATAKDQYYTGGEHADTSEDIVKQLLQGQYDRFIILKGIFPEATAHLIPANEQFGFCHIDVDVYASARDIVNWVWDKLMIGGIILFDDFGFHTCDGITTLVNEQRNMADRIVIHNLNGHAILMKVR